MSKKSGIHESEVPLFASNGSPVWTTARTFQTRFNTNLSPWKQSLLRGVKKKNPPGPHPLHIAKKFQKLLETGSVNNQAGRNHFWPRHLHSRKWDRKFSNRPPTAFKLVPCPLDTYWGRRLTDKSTAAGFRPECQETKQQWSLINVMKKSLMKNSPGFGCCSWPTAT